MRNLRILAALGLLATAAAANAEVSGTAAIVSDYDFRGISQTGEDPAVQLSIDYGHESGWYVGTWGSNVDFGVDDPSTEVDLYTGFKGTAGDFGWDAGIVYYAYPSASDLSYPEIYGKFSYNIVSAGVYYSNSFGSKDNDEAIYVYGDVGIPAGPLTIGLHAGYSTGDGIEQTYGGFGGVEDSYFDYSVGLSYTASNITLGMKWVAYDADISSDDRVILSISTALPWGE
ncbi:MAG TPA: TorF family putative porin [Steroidobacteraceae bacterium]|nr:TorF family putative porin [Steroidobacteraceae bacterium]